MKFALTVSGVGDIRHSVYHSYLAGNVSTGLLVTQYSTVGQFDVIVLQIGFVEGITGQLVYSFERISVELVTAATFHNLVCTRYDTVLVLVGQFHNLVLQEGGIGSQVNGPVLVTEDVNISIDLNTTVGDSTQIACHGSFGCCRRSGSCRKGQINVEQQVFVSLVKVLYAQVPTVEQTCLDSHTIGLARLPLQVVRVVLAQEKGSFVSILRYRIKAHVAIVAGSCIVTYLTVVGTQLQVVHPAYVFHKVFFADYPVGSHTAEVTPTVIGMEA